MKYPSGPRRDQKWNQTQDAVLASWVYDNDGPRTDVNKMIEELEKRGWRFQPEEEQKK